MTRDEILAAAAAVVAERARTHGDAARSLGLFEALCACLPPAEPTPARACLRMMLLKIARAWDNPDHADHWIDLAGYAALGGELAGEKETPESALGWPRVESGWRRFDDLQAALHDAGRRLEDVHAALREAGRRAVPPPVDAALGGEMALAEETPESALGWLSFEDAHAALREAGRRAAAPPVDAADCAAEPLPPGAAWADPEAPAPRDPHMAAHAAALAAFRRRAPE